MGEWEFFRIPGSSAGDAPFLWSWRCVRRDGGKLSTGKTFRFFLDCVADARLHGYCNGPLLTRREPELGFVTRIADPPMRAAA